VSAAQRRGTAAAALANREFRLVYIGSLLSNVGTWMQNVVLPAFVYTRTDSASLVGLMIVAQLGPLFVLAIPAGAIADRVDRRRWIVTMQMVQLGFSAVIGVLALGDPSFSAVFLAALGVGIGNALTAPAWSALVPSLVGPEDMPGAISLNSFAINGSRVIGPIVVAGLSAWGLEASAFFFINAVTYLFVVVALLNVHVPKAVPDSTRGVQRLTVGFRVARDQREVGMLLFGISSFSLLSLPYVGLFPAVARLNFGIDEASSTYKWLYATWGFGAALGGLAIGTVVHGRDARRLIRAGFAGFAAALAAFAVVRTPAPAFVAGFALGFFYFFTTTSMLTVLQSRLDERVRARVMSLWIMGFGGTVPFGNVIFGPVMDRWGAPLVLLIGAAWALLLAWWCDVARVDRRAGRSA
jgi:MFS family permease